MSNYNLVIDTSNFRPYDYSLAYRAVQDYNRGYGESQAVYDKIAQTLGDLASAVEGSTRAKQIYDDYQNRFNAAADEFSRGMDVRTATELGALRKIYGTQIRQLERANEARAKAAELLKVKNKDDDYLHESLGTLDAWMEDPNREIRGYSGSKLTSQVGDMMTSVAKSMRELNNNGRLDAFNKMWIESGGFSPEKVSKAIVQLQRGGIDAVEDPIIKGVLQNVAASSGMDGWADEATLRKRNEYMARGLYKGIGETKLGHYEDYAAKKAEDFRWREKEKDADFNRKIEEARKIAEIKGLDPSSSSYPGSDYPMHFTDETASQSMKLQMAAATADYIWNHAGNNKYASQIRAQWKDKGGMKGAIEYWAENGIDASESNIGKKSDKDTLYYGLGNYIRNNVTKNENMINIWRSPYTKMSSTNAMQYFGSHDAQNSWAAPPNNNKQVYSKDWGSFNDEARKSFAITVTDTHDDADVLAHYLSRGLNRVQNINGKVGLYSIKNIDKDGKITYDTANSTSFDELPIKEGTTTVNGKKIKEIDTSKINKVTLPDGSWLLEWHDGDGNLKSKVWRRQDMSNDMIASYNSLQRAIKATYDEYGDDPKQLNYWLGKLKQRWLGNDYSAQQEVNVKPTEIR